MRQKIGQARQREQQREETRQRVYESALAIFRRDGVADATIDDIAKAAEVSRGTFYVYFPTKEDVLAEMLARSEARHADHLRELAVQTPLRSVLGVLCSEISNEWRAEPVLSPQMGAVALKLSAQGPWTTASGLRGVLGQHFGAAIARGELESTLPAQLLADFFLINLFAALMAWSARPELNLDDVLSEVVRFFFFGARGPSA
jgi:AcrR family transcriptional regulator